MKERGDEAQGLGQWGEDGDEDLQGDGDEDG